MDAKKLRDLLLADRIDEVVTALASDPNRALDQKGANALFFATTPAMLDALLDAGVDPRRVLDDGTSTIDAPAREGQLAMVRSLLVAARELATEARALMAADHPATEDLIRTVARGGDPEPKPEKPTAIQLREVPTTASPPRKGSQRYHHPARPGAVTNVPDAVRARVPANAELFEGHGDVLVAFPPEGGPVLIDPAREDNVQLPITRVPFPYEYAFAGDGSHYFFGYGHMRVVGVEVASQTIVVDESPPGGPWGTVMASLPGEINYGHMYPIRMCVSGEWLAYASLERIVFLAFGSLAAKAARIWFTCQLGTCAASVLGGRVVVIGARAGSAAYGVDGARVQKLCDLEPPPKKATKEDPVQAQIRMILRASGKGHDDPRTVSIAREGDGAWVRAFGVGGLHMHEVFVPGLDLDESAVSSAPVTATEIVDAYMRGRDVVVRVSPIGHDHVASYAIDGLETLWTSSFAERALGAIEGDALVVRRSPLPPPIPLIHPKLGELSYPTVGRNGYAVGYKVSARPGFWNTYVVSKDGVKQVSPPWFNGATNEGLHEREPRAVLASGREAIEIDLATAKRVTRSTGSVRGICYFDGGIALLLEKELQLLPAIDAAPSRVVPVDARDAQLASFHDHRVLWVPTAGDHNVLLARRDGELVVVGVFDAAASGEVATPEGAYLKVASGVLQLANFERAIATAPSYTGAPLHALREPRIEIV